MLVWIVRLYLDLAWTMASKRFVGYCLAAGLICRTPNKVWTVSETIDGNLTRNAKFFMTSRYMTGHHTAQMRLGILR